MCFVGGSAGGMEAFTTIIRELPATFQAAVFTVLHIPSSRPSMLPKIFGRATLLKVVPNLKDGGVIRPGQIYVAPSDYHLLLELGRVRLRHGRAEKRNRPAVDPLFRSAARTYGSRVIGIVLSGLLNDGTDGLSAIKKRGGIVMVQEHGDALHPGMPLNAMKNLMVDFCLPVAKMPGRLMNLVGNAS